MAKGKGGGGLSLYPFSVCEGAKILLATPATGRRTERLRSGVGGTTRSRGHDHWAVSPSFRLRSVVAVARTAMVVPLQFFLIDGGSKLEIS